MWKKILSRIFWISVIILDVIGITLFLLYIALKIYINIIFS